MSPAAKHAKHMLDGEPAVSDDRLAAEDGRVRRDSTEEIRFAASAGHDPPADHATSVPFSGRLAVFDEPSRPVEVGVHARLMASSDDSGPAGGRAGLQIDVAAEITCAIEHRRQASCSRATTARKPSGTARRRGSGSPGSKRCSGNYAPIACGNMKVMIYELSTGSRIWFNLLASTSVVGWGILQPGEGDSEMFWRRDLTQEKRAA